MPNMPLSHYQQAIVDWVANPRPDARFAFARARAGCGKTSTAVAAVAAQPGSGRKYPSGDPVPSVLIAAFNNAIRDEIAAEVQNLKHVEVKGIHQLGLRCVSAAYGKGLQVESGRYWRGLIRMVLSAIAAGPRDSGLTSEQFIALRDSQWGVDLRTVQGEVRNGIDLARGVTQPVLKATRALCDKARLSLTDPRDPAALDACAIKFGILVPDGWEDFVRNAVLALMQHGCWPDSIREDGCIDFIDMIWLPVINGLRPFALYDLVVIDEAQDLSPAQLALALKFCGARGRGLFLGDDLQSIYAFAGADSQSVPKIIETTGAVVLPLPVCYRCDESILKVGRYWASDLEARPGAGQGVVAVVKGDLSHAVRPGDMLVARKNSTLVGTLFALLSKGVPAVLKGRPEMTDSLVDRAFDMAKRGNIWEGGVSDVAKAHLAAEFELILAKNRGDTSDPVLTELQDQVLAVTTLIVNFGSRSLDDFEARLKRLFDTSDETDANVVTLTSAHRSKGLGAERVFILAPDEFPMVRWCRDQREDETREAYEKWIEEVWMHPAAVARREEDARQEANLMYVAVTRAKRSLIFCETVGGFVDAVLAADVLPSWAREDAYRKQSERAAAKRAQTAESKVKPPSPPEAQPKPKPEPAPAPAPEPPPQLELALALEPPPEALPADGPPDDLPVGTLGLDEDQCELVTTGWGTAAQTGHWHDVGELLGRLTTETQVVVWNTLRAWFSGSGSKDPAPSSFGEGFYQGFLTRTVDALRAKRGASTPPVPGTWVEHEYAGTRQCLRALDGDYTAVVVLPTARALGETLGHVEVHQGPTSPDPLQRSLATMRAEATMRIAQGRRLILTWGEQTVLDRLTPHILDLPIPADLR